MSINDVDCGTNPYLIPSLQQEDFTLLANPFDSIQRLAKEFLIHVNQFLFILLCDVSVMINMGHVCPADVRQFSLDILYIQFQEVDR